MPLRYNARSLIERPATSLMTIMGVSLVAMIVVILFGFMGGLKRTLLNAGGAEDWIVLNAGALDETASFISHDKIDILRVRPEIMLDADHQVLLSPEIFAGVSVGLDKRIKQFALMRGVEAIAYRVHRSMRLVSGHWPVRGKGEWVIGQKLELRQPHLGPGTQFHYGRRNWNIVGVFTDADSARESEIWTDYEDLRVDAQHQGRDTNSIHVALKAGTGQAFAQALKKDGRLELDAITEAQYYAEQARVAAQVQSLGLIVALALGVGAIFGGMNTMYTAIARREREIGVLRVLGFTRGDIIASFIAESAMLGLAAGVVGQLLALGVAWATGLNSRLMSIGQTFFSYRPTIGVFIAGLVVATVIGITGGLLPASRATRINIIDSIREA